VDVLDAVAKRMKIPYSLHPYPAHMQLDAYLKTFNSTGMDMLIGEIPITQENNKLAALSAPIRPAGIGALTMKKNKGPESWFSFLNPFSGWVWGMWVLMAIVYGITIYHLESENTKYFPRDSYGLMIRECSWHVLNMSMQYREKEISTVKGKTLASAYAFVVMVLLAMYMANLAAVITSQSIDEGIEALSDLKSQSVGTLCQGSRVEKFLNLDTSYRTLVCYKHLPDAVKALKRNEINLVVYNQLTLEYYATSDSNCELELEPVIFATDQFAFAFQLAYRDNTQGGEGDLISKFNQHILYLRETGQIFTMTRKWFRGTSCETTITTNDETITVEDCAGSFVVFASGVVVAGLLLGFRKCTGVQLAGGPVPTPGKKYPTPEEETGVESRLVDELDGNKKAKQEKAALPKGGNADFI